MDTIKFAAETSQVQPVEDEKGNKYEIREITAAQRDSYATKMAARMGAVGDGENKVVITKDFKDYHAALLVLCMFSEDGKPVTLEQVRKWPASQTALLHNAASELNGLNGPLKQLAEKND